MAVRADFGQGHGGFGCLFNHGMAVKAGMFLNVTFMGKKGRVFFVSHGALVKKDDHHD